MSCAELNAQSGKKLDSAPVFYEKCCVHVVFSVLCCIFNPRQFPVSSFIPRLLFLHRCRCCSEPSTHPAALQYYTSAVNGTDGTIFLTPHAPTTASKESAFNKMPAGENPKYIRVTLAWALYTLNHGRKSFQNCLFKKATSFITHFLKKSITR